MYCFFIWLAGITQLSSVKAHRVFISPPGNKVVFYQVQQPLNTVYTISQQKKQWLVASHFRYMVTSCLNGHFLTRISGSVDQTSAIWLCKTIDPPAGVQVQSDYCSIGRHCLLNFKSSHSFFIGKLKADSVTNQTLKANTELFFLYVHTDSCLLSGLHPVSTKA